MENTQEKAKQLFANNYNCSQSVFAALGGKFGFNEDFCLKVACAFGGGVARNQEICGAVSGALMAIGLKYGSGVNDGVEKKAETYSVSNEFLKQFKEKHKTTTCLELLDNLNMRDETEYKEIASRNLFTERCPVFVASAVEIAENLLKM